MDLGFSALESLDIWRLLAGLGIFLFGMFLLEEGIQTISGGAFQRLLANFTSNRFKAILTGTVSTAVLQSSSAVSLMVLAFVGAEVLGIANAIGVIIGSNLGTTATAWIVATIGFKIDIESFAMPFIGLGGLGLIFLGKKPRYAAISRLITGFGFLFMGLSYMKEAVTAFTESVGIAYFEQFPSFMYLVAGILLTAVIQSSSASLAILLSAVNAGISDFHEAALFVIGANIGTTFTVFLGALGAGAPKKQVAASHLFFNWITGIFAFISLPVLMQLVDVLVGGSQDALLRITVFHTLFNFIGVILFLPFTHLLGSMVERLFPIRLISATRFVSQVPAGVGEAAVDALKKEVAYLLIRTLQYKSSQLGCNNLSSPGLIEKDELPEEAATNYGQLKEINQEMYAFAGKINQDSLTIKQSEVIQKCLFSARMALFSAKWIRQLGIDFSLVEKEFGIQEKLRRSMINHQEIMINTLANNLKQKTVGVTGYDQMKLVLKDLNHQGEQSILSAFSTSVKHDGILLSQLLTLQKTWYLAWRNYLLALRELIPGAELETVDDFDPGG